MNDFRTIRVSERVLVERGADAAAYPASEPSSRSVKRHLSAEGTLMLHQCHRAWLTSKLKEPFNGRAVVVTHHALHRASLARRYANSWDSGAFVSELPSDFFDVPEFWLHGPRLLRLPGRDLPCRLQPAGPRGYLLQRNGMRPENEAFNPGLVIEVFG